MSIAGGCDVGGRPPIHEVIAVLAALDAGAAKCCLSMTGVALAGGDAAWADPDLPGAAVVEGQIHNRRELRGGLGHNDGPTRCDAELVMALFRRHGEGCLDLIRGDFACAIWDGRKGRLVLARSATGGWPLHYWSDGARLFFASEPRGLLALARVPPALDQARLAEIITRLPPAGNASPFCHIPCLASGHLLIAEGGRTRVERWWRPLDRPMLHLPRDEDYADALRQALDTAVGRRLPAAGAVASHLSAGLDSSGVAALAARRLAGEGRRLWTFTAVPHPSFAPPAPAGVKDGLWDEGPPAARMAAGLPNVTHAALTTEGWPLLRTLRQATAILDSPPPNMFNLSYLLAIAEAAAAAGCETMLAAPLGNTTASYDGRMLRADRLRRLQLGAMAGDLAESCRAGRLSGFVRQTVRPFLPAAAITVFRRLAGRASNPALDIVALNPAFARESGVAERLRRRNPMVRWRGDSRRYRLATLATLDSSAFAAAIRRHWGVVQLDPTVDRDLVELCLSIPERQFCLGGVPRSLARRALDGLVPAEILTRRSYGIQSADWPMVVSRERDAIAAELRGLRDSPFCRACLDLDRLDQLIATWPSRDWRDKGTYSDFHHTLGPALMVGLFARRMELGLTPPASG